MQDPQARPTLHTAENRPEYARSLSLSQPEQAGWVALTPARAHGSVRRMGMLALEWIVDAPIHPASAPDYATQSPEAVYQRHDHRPERAGSHR